MADYGLLATGFAAMPAAIAHDQMVASVRAKRSVSSDVTDGSVLGQFIGILSEREGSLWDAINAVASSADPDAATDAAQDDVCTITGTFRRAARSSIATCILTGVPATVIGAGSQGKTSAGNLFVTANDATIATVLERVALAVHVIGDRVVQSVVGGFARVYQCTTGGTSNASASGGLTVTDLVIATDGTVVWTYIGDGSGAVDAPLYSIVKDAIAAAARDLTINTPVGGWQTLTNLTDATLGALRQTNESLRVTRDAEISEAGSGTADSIRAKIRAIDGVTACSVFHNETDAVDGNGQPAHSVQALVVGGTDAAIGAVLLANVDAGIITFGTTPIDVLDSMGTTQHYFFTRLSQVNAYVDVTLTYNPALASKGGYPTTGDTDVKTAVAGLNPPGGKDLVASSTGAVAFPVYVNGVLVLGVQGVLDVTTLVYTDVIGAAAAWLALTAYSATPGSRSVVTNDARTYICVTAGTSAASGGPIGTGTNITDGTAHWYFLGTTISVDAFHIAMLDSSRVTVHSTAGAV